MINNGKTLHTLLDFDFIVNTELGLIRLIREEYRDSRAFNMDIVDKSDREILSLLSSRKNSNPLSIISTDENFDDIDALYADFLKSKYKEILAHCVSLKNIVNFVNMMILTSNSNSGSDTTINVHNILQERFIKTAFNFKGTYVETSEILENKDPIYAKDFTFFTSEPILLVSSYKNIYLYDRVYNREYCSNTDSIFTKNNRIVIIKEL